MKGGTFVISLDFELMWGVRDKRTIADYGANILGVRQAIPAMLDLFAERAIACTWATVGLLFYGTKREVLDSLPASLPAYYDPRLSPYPDISATGGDEKSDPYHYGLSLLRQIAASPRQEIATHTFSHFYCLEDGGTVDAFRADLLAAKTAAERLDISLRSIAFPRNQISLSHLAVCKEIGIRAFRGNEDVWFHRAGPDARQTLFMRGARLADAHLPIGGQHVHEAKVVVGLVDIPASRFLRPTFTVDPLKSLRLHRITSAMTNAARDGKIFHLWWHPHNFGVDLKSNLAFLRVVLDCYRKLQKRHGMRSLTMAAVADEILDA